MNKTCFCTQAEENISKEFNLVYRVRRSWNRIQFARNLLWTRDLKVKRNISHSPLPPLQYNIVKQSKIKNLTLYFGRPHLVIHWFLWNNITKLHRIIFAPHLALAFTDHSNTTQTDILPCPPRLQAETCKLWYNYYFYLFCSRVLVQIEFHSCKWIWPLRLHYCGDDAITGQEPGTLQW